MSNKLLPVHEPSRKYAVELCKGCKTKHEKWYTITNYVSRAFAYDYIRAILISKKNGVPDLDRTWKLHMGICLDIASLTVGMLRAVGINANMAFGKVGRYYHAWVEANIDGEFAMYDHDAKPGKTLLYKKTREIC